MLQYLFIASRLIYLLIIKRTVEQNDIVAFYTVF